MPEKRLSSLQLRIISALVLAPIAIVALVLGGSYFILFLGLAAAAMCFEWCRTSISAHVPLFTVITGLTVLSSLYMAFIGELVLTVAILFGGSVILLVLSSFLKQKTDRIWAFFGPLVAGVPILSLAVLRGLPDIGFAVTTSLFLVIWATDIGAYFSGKTIGGPKIAPVISPNKTWAGLIGGMIAAMLVAFCAAYFLINNMNAPFGILLLGAVGAILAQAGDFTESAWKRKFGIKDASNLIPGHGGVLDRLDGILFVAPALLGLILITERT